MKKPLKKLEEFERIHFTSASQGWDNHTQHLHGELFGYDKSCDDWEQYLAWVVKELKGAKKETEDLYSYYDNRIIDQLIQSIESGEGGGE